MGYCRQKAMVQRSHLPKWVNEWEYTQECRLWWFTIPATRRLEWKAPSVSAVWNNGKEKSQYGFIVCPRCVWYVMEAPGGNVGSWVFGEMFLLHVCHSWDSSFGITHKPGSGISVFNPTLTLNNRIINHTCSSKEEHKSWVPSTGCIVSQICFQSPSCAPGPGGVACYPNTPYSPQ